MPQLEQSQATGRRKAAIARVYLRPGEGKISINGRDLDEYFSRQVHRSAVLLPLQRTGLGGKFDLLVKVRGGGHSGQAGAIRHGVARAILLIDPEQRDALKKSGLLTRDARVKERKKYGQPGARKSYQYSKR